MIMISHLPKNVDLDSIAVYFDPPPPPIHKISIV